jgi:glycosyltransferase involved in cell wall biosynthesis
VLFVNGGPLEQKFKNLCDATYDFSRCTIKSGLFKTIYKKLANRLGFKSQSKDALFYNNIAQNNYHLIYANTIVSIPLGFEIKKRSPDAKMIVHVHEMNTIISTLLPNFGSYINAIDFFIAASNPVKQNLIHNWNISNDLVELIYAFSVAQHQETDKELTSVFTVGGSGLSYWRKGNDLFLQVARYIKKHYEDANINFVWVGHEYLDKPIIDADLQKLELQNNVSFIGEKSNPETYYNNFDVFILPSREDPFPLVCIEVAKLSKPIICFEKASGTAEVIAKGGGFVVPYLDIEAMAEKIMYYYNNPNSLKKDGKKAQLLFADYVPEKICPLIYQKIQSLL